MSKPIAPRKLIADLRELIEATRTGVARAVYSAQVLLHWQVGHRILADILRHERASYGEEIVATVSRQLAAGYGRNFVEKSLRRMMQLAVCCRAGRCIGAGILVASARRG